MGEGEGGMPTNHGFCLEDTKLHHLSPTGSAGSRENSALPDKRRGGRWAGRRMAVDSHS